MVDFIRDKILYSTDNGWTVFTHYIDVPIVPEKKFLNPLYPDTHPSCHIHRDKKTGICIFKDFGSEGHKGDCFWFVQTKFGITFSEAKEKIIRDMNLSIEYRRYTGVPRTEQITIPKIQVQEPVKVEIPTMKHYRITETKWRKADLDYWGTFHIDRSILEMYNVIPLIDFQIVDEDGKTTLSLRRESGKLMYGYKRDTFIKVYSPGAKDFRFVYGGNVPSPYIFGYEQLTHNQDYVLITAGEKDAMAGRSQGFDTISLNGENATIPDFLLDSLAREYKHVIMIYDTDDTGKKRMQKVAEEYSKDRIIPVMLPLPGTKSCKDLSDFFAMGNTRADLLRLIKSKLDELYHQERILFGSCIIDLATPPPVSKTLISYGDTKICTVDNIICVTGQTGTGKSNFVGALAAGALVTDPEKQKIDTLGLTIAPNLDKHAVLYFDTEQSYEDFWTNSQRILARARYQEKPDHFLPVHLLKLSVEERLKMIEYGMEIAHQRYGGIHMVILDGIADLIQAANDEGDSVAVVKRVSDLASKYHTAIVCVLHMVPNGLKIRGHIGSEMERKASAIIALEVDNDTENPYITVVKLRQGDKKAVPKILFSWDREESMFMYAGVKSLKKAEAPKEKFNVEAIIKLLFKPQMAPLTTNYLLPIIMALQGCKERTAEKILSQMSSTGYITKIGNKGYVLDPTQRLSL